MSRSGRWLGLKVAAGVATLRLLGPTWRVRWVGLDRVEQARRAGNGAVIYAFWHQRMLPFCYTHRGQGIQVMVSTHRDGELIARVIHALGFGTVRGSSTRGGLKALFGMATQGRVGFDLAVTPDGPRGPRHVVKPGVVLLAWRTGLPVVPAANATWPRFELGSWDAFHVPWPWARCVVVMGEPWFAKDPRQASWEVQRRELEDRLHQVTREAERLCRG